MLVMVVGFVAARSGGGWAARAWHRWGVCSDGDFDLFPSSVSSWDGPRGVFPWSLEGSWGRPFTHWTLAWNRKTGCHARMRAHMLATHRGERMDKGGPLGVMV